MWYVYVQTLAITRWFLVSSWNVYFPNFLQRACDFFFYNKKPKIRLGLKELSRSLLLRGKSNSGFHTNKTPQPITLLVIKVVSDAVLFSTRLPERVKRRGQQGWGISRLKSSQSWRPLLWGSIDPSESPTAMSQRKHHISQDSLQAQRPVGMNSNQGHLIKMQTDPLIPARRTSTASHFLHLG